jgi:hypothetical protein
MAKLPEPPKLTFSYGVVERALAVAYRIPDAVRPAGFRSMLANLQKLGALGAQARVGRGRALTYTPVELHRLMLTLELCELGVPPATSVSIVETHWEPKLWPIISAALVGVMHGEPGGNDMILYLSGVSLRTGALRGEAPGAPNIGRCSLDALPAAITRWMATTPDDPAPPRGLIVNLSERLRAFHRALADANLDDALAERVKRPNLAEVAPRGAPEMVNKGEDQV